MYDVQADEMPLADFQALTAPLPVLRYLLTAISPGVPGENPRLSAERWHTLFT